MEVVKTATKSPIKTKQHFEFHPIHSKDIFGAAFWFIIPHGLTKLTHNRCEIQHIYFTASV